MVVRNPGSNSICHQCIAPQTIAGAGDVEGTGIDTRGAKHAKIFVSIGTQGTAAVATVTIEASTTLGGTYAALTGGSFTVTEASSEDETLYIVEVDLAHMPAGKHFLTVSIASATQSTPASVEIELYNNRDTTRFDPSPAPVLSL